MVTIAQPFLIFFINLSYHEASGRGSCDEMSKAWPLA